MTAPEVIRVFVSSTFKDMKEEREELVKRTFPELRKRCLARGIEFAAVDLRWGINEESEVLPICLDQIQRCSMFLGILGERHGSIPEVDEVMKEAEPWLLDYPEASLTEIEILRAALDGSTVRDARFFYFRDPSYAKSKGGDFLPENQDEQNRVAGLKNRIASSSLTPRGEPYRDPTELGRWVLADLGAAIDRILPSELDSDPWSQEAARQSILEALLCRSYVGTERMIARLDQLTDSSDRAVLVSGPPGIGKSSLLAMWLNEMDRRDKSVVSYFVDAAAVASWTYLVQRVARLLISEYQLDIDIPEDEKGLRELLGGVFNRIAGSRHRCVLVLDGIDGLEPDDGAHELGWLPVSTPEEVTIVLSARSGAAVAETERRGWRRLEIKSLSADERREIATSYLAQYGKALTDGGLADLAKASANGNPRFLKTVLNEIRQWGDYETVDSEVARLSQARGTYALFKMVLERLEADFGAEHPDLVPELMALLWAVPAGLSESELVEMLGADGPLPQSVFGPVFLSIEPLLSSSGGTVRLTDPGMRDLVADRYLHDPESRATLHSYVADYFSSQPVDQRVAQLLPNQLLQAGRDDSLFELLTDPDFLGTVYETSRTACIRFWAHLEESGFTLVSGLNQVLGELRALPEEERDGRTHLLFYLADLLGNAGWMSAAVELWEFLVEIAEAAGHEKGTKRALHGLHEALTEMGRQDEARAVLDRLLDLPGESSSDLGTGRTTEIQALDRRARELIQLHQYDEALDTLDQQEALLRGLGQSRDLAMCYSNKAVVLASKGWVAEAVRVLEIQERVLADLGDRLTLQRSLNYRAQLLAELDRFDEALVLLDQQEQICRLVDNPNGLVDCLSTRALVLEMQGSEAEAATTLAAALRVARERGLTDRERALGGKPGVTSD